MMLRHPKYIQGVLQSLPKYPVAICASLVTCPALQKEKKSEESKTPFHLELPSGEKKSFFHYFKPKKGITVDMLNRLQKGVDLRPASIREWVRGKRQIVRQLDQTFCPDRLQILGFDLAAAHFIVHRNGKVWFKNAIDWTCKNEDEDYDLPRFYEPDIFVERIDASGMDLVYEGFECIDKLKHLKWLSLSGCPYIDDWCVDRLCGQFAESLEFLDLSNCHLITHRGISALTRLRYLKTLNLTGLDHVDHLKLLCHLLEDKFPEIEIIGVDYMTPEPIPVSKELPVAS